MIYLDHAASTPLAPEAARAMAPWFQPGEAGRFGNPSGAHGVSGRAREALEDARDIVAGCLGARPREVVFTSGGTEALNMAVQGRRGRIVMSAIEHEALRQPVFELQRTFGVDVAEAAVGSDGVLDVDRFRALALDRPTELVAIMSVNNEVGTVQPIGEVAKVMREIAPGSLMLVDAVCAAPWLELAQCWGHADLLALSGHKFGGPQGIGVLVVREATQIHPLLHGGGQERERRSGTPNVVGAVGLAAALQAVERARTRTVASVAPLRDRLVDQILAEVDGATETGDRLAKVGGNAHLCIDGVESEALLVLLDEAGVCASAGSACASGALQASHVLLAMGIPKERALGSLRLTLSHSTTEEDVAVAADAVIRAVARLRA